VLHDTIPLMKSQHKCRRVYSTMAVDIASTLSIEIYSTVLRRKTLVALLVQSSTLAHLVVAAEISFTSTLSTDNGRHLSAPNIARTQPVIAV